MKGVKHVKKLDLSYLCSTIGSLCGFPVRMYEGDELVFKVDHSGLKYDPVISCQISRKAHLTEPSKKAHHIR